MTNAGVNVTGFNSTVENTSLPLTVEYTENGITQSTTYNVEVKDSVKSISIKTMPKQNYRYNEELDVSTGVLEVVKGSETVEIPMTTDMVTGYTKTDLGDQILTVTYGGQTATYTVNVKDYVTGIKIDPDTVTGTYNDELSSIISANNIEYTVTYAKAGDTASVALDASMVAGYNKQTTDAQSLTVTYTDSDINSASKDEQFTATLNITLQNTVSSVTITPPTKTNYEHGDSLDLTGGKVTLTYADNTTQDIALEESMITENGSSVNMSPTVSDYVNNQVSKNLTITYGTETESYNITIKNPIDSIAIATSPKTSYNLNESTTGVGGTLTVTRKAGNTETVNIEDSMVTSLDTSVAGAGKTATVSYTENGVTKTTTYTYDVIDNVSSIVITAPTKDTYNHGESLDLTGGTITVTYASGTSSNVTMTESMITENSAAVNMSPAASDYTNNKVSKTLTITYTENGVTEDISYPITIINDVKSISVTTEPKTQYNVGDTLDVSTGVIEVTRATGTLESIPMTNAGVNVTGFDNSVENTNLQLTVEYTENGITQSTNYTVSVIDAVLDVKIENTPKTAYKYGEPLDVSEGTLKITRSSGDEIINITENMVTELDGSAFDSTIIGTRNLNVIYGGKTMTYEVTVSDYVTGIVLIPPTKLIYEYGESLDLTGGSIDKIMASGTSESVSLSDSNVTVSSMDSTTVGAQTINVGYDGFTAQFGVTVQDNIQSITITNTPKQNYKYGEALDVTGGTILATRSSGNTETIPMTNSMVSGYDPTVLGPQTLTVEHNGKTATYSVNVEDYVKGIEIVKPTKSIYEIGETIDLTGGQVILKMASGTASSPVAMTNAMISGFDSSSVGVKTIKVNYQDFEKEFGITVQDSATGITVTKPNKDVYKYGEALNLTGATITIQRLSGDAETFNITKDMVSGYDSKKVGIQQVSVTYENMTAYFDVEVVDYVSGLKVTKPNKVEYEYGEELDLAGGKVSIVMASGKVAETTDLTASMIVDPGYNKNQVGSQTINIVYKDLTGSFKVNVVDEIKGISMNTQPNKTNYQYGESLDLTGATITVVKSSGIKVIPVTKDMVSGFKPQNAGTQVITVNYGGFETSFIVTVEKQVITETEPKDEPIDEPENKPTTKPSNKPNYVINNNIQINTPVEEPKEEEPQVEEQPQEQVQPPKQEDNKEQEKPTVTLGVKDEKDDDEDKGDIIKLIAGIIGGIGIILLILLLVFKRNVKVYVEEDGEFVLGGLDKLSKKNLKLDIDQFLDNETYPNRVRIVLNDSISNKLDGEELEITHRGSIVKHKIVYNDKPYELILESLNQK